METLWERGVNIVVQLREFKIPLILAAISLSAFVTLGIYLYQTSLRQTPLLIQKGESQSTVSAQSRTIMVDIAGGVNAPGVYMLPDGSRIHEAIQRAGGFSVTADKVLVEKGINQASRLMDGAKVFIPMKNSKENSVSKVDNTSHNILSEEESGSSLISINTATQSELETLPGVGQVTAQKIINNRPYLSLDELKTKEAVGKKLFEAILPQIIL